MRESWLCMQAPVLLRLVFHDAGTYAAATGDGGANGSLRFELDRPENRGLKVSCAGTGACVKQYIA